MRGKNVNFLLQFGKPRGCKMDILQHNPSSLLHCFFHRFFGKIKSFRATDSYRKQFWVQLFTKLLNLKAGVKTRSTWQKDRFFSFARLNDLLEIESISFTALITQHCFHNIVGEWVEFVWSEYLDENEVENFLLNWGCFDLDVGEVFFWVAGEHEADPLIFVLLDMACQIGEERVISELLQVF